MFDIGLGELVFIFIVFLVLFGPKSLPDLARKTASVLNKVKQAQAEFQSQINSISNDIQSTIEIDKTNAGIKLDDIKNIKSNSKKVTVDSGSSDGQVNKASKTTDKNSSTNNNPKA